MVPDSVLLVDDEAIVLDVLSLALSKKNLLVKTTNSLAEALKLLATEQFGCVLVDKNLPDGSGLELIRKVRELQPFAACMVMTGYPNVASILEALRLGAVDYLEKPFPQMSIVQEKVRAAIDRQKVLAEHAELAARLKRLAAAPEGGPAESERAMLEQSLAAAREDAERSREAMRAELDELTRRLEAVKGRHARTLAALRQGAAQLGVTLERGDLPKSVEFELREARRELTSVLEDSEPPPRK